MKTKKCVSLQRRKAEGLGLHHIAYEAVMK